MNTMHGNEKIQWMNRNLGDVLVMDGMGDFTRELPMWFAAFPRTAATQQYLLQQVHKRNTRIVNDELSEKQEIIDQAMAILRGLRAKSAEGALALANEVMGY